MNRFTHFLIHWRMIAARKYIPKGSRVLDIGCFDGTLFRFLGDHISGGVGIDPSVRNESSDGHFRLIPGRFPEGVPKEMTFDVITLLAVIEHFKPEILSQLSINCAMHLKPGGLVIITVPSAFLDPILHVLAFFHIISPMSLEEHHGFEPETTTTIF